jgi:Transposase DDE domain
MMPTGTRLERQRRQSLAKQLADLSQQCAIGVKKNSNGHEQYWRGYKLHTDVAGGQIPISVLLTGAHVHDSQAAIPLMTMSTARALYLYELMDSAHDAAAIREHSLQLGHRPITDHSKRLRKTVSKLPLCKNPRSWKLVTETEWRADEMTWAERDRFAERTMVERVFARLKDEFGLRAVRVRGAKKVIGPSHAGVA